MSDSEISEKRSISSEKEMRFAHDVLKLALGTAFAQALSIVISPILTRLYTPESFGLVALFGSIVGIISIVACLQYEQAIILPKSNEEAANLLGLCIFFVTLISIVIIPVTWLVGPQILSLINATKLGPYVWFIPISVFASGVFNALNYWNSRSKHFGRLSVARINSQITLAGVQLGANTIGNFHAVGLILGAVAGSVVSTLVLGGQIWRDDKRMLRGSINSCDMVKSFRRYKDFPIYNTWSILLNTISWQVPTILLSAYFSSTIVGYYYLSMVSFQLPMSLVASSISQVFLQRSAEARHSGDLPALVGAVVLRLGKVALFPAMLLLIVGKDAFSVVFGAHWTEAGIYAQILAPWLFFAFIASPLSVLFLVFERLKFQLIINAFFLPMRVGAIVLGGLLGNARIAIILFAATGIIVHGVTLLWIVWASGTPVSGIMKNLGKYSAFVLLLLCSVLFAKLFLSLQPVLIVSFGCLMALPYYAVVVKNDDALKRSLLNMYQSVYSRLTSH